MKTIGRRTKINALVGASILVMTSAAQAVVIDFTGGTVNNANAFVYQENGYQVSSIGGTSYFGDYYSAGNDVIHSHWAGGGFGTVTSVQVTQLLPGTFDLNYFILTSNTITGGGAANGTERAWITHDGNLDPILLPPENWGFPATQIWLPASYDVISSFEFHVTSQVACFGMDEFYINEAAPTPDGGTTVSLLGLAMFGIAAIRRKLKAS